MGVWIKNSSVTHHGNNYALQTDCVTMLAQTVGRGL